MKKIILIVNLLLACAGMTFAQTAPKKDTTKTKTKTAATATTAKPASGPLKKDGTADMRYKSNKDAAKAKPAGPLKKDGTADMRYKANKTDTTKKKKS